MTGAHDAPWRRAAVPAALLAVAAIYAASLLWLPAEGFWINDNAAKFLQMRAIVDSGYRDFSITLPGRPVDPGLEFNPLVPPYFQVSGGKIYCQYSLAFALLSSVPYRLLGQRGLALLPLFSSLLMLAGCARLAALLGAGRGGAAVVVSLAALATPVWFYSLTYWEHTPAACLLVWGLYHLVRSLPAGDRRRAFLGGLLLALAVAFRDELYLFLPVAAGAATLHTARGRRAGACAAAAAGALAGLVPLWLLQGMALGMPLGFHLQGALPADTGFLRQLAARPRLFHDLFLAVGNVKPLSAVLTAPFIAAAAFGHRCTGRTPGVAGAATLAALCGLVFLAGFGAGTEGVIPRLIASNSLWPAAPALILAFFAPPLGEHGRSGCRMLLHVVLVYAVVYWLCVPAWRVTGLHWGNRQLFALYPLLAVPAGMGLAAAWRRGDGRRAARRVALAAVAAVGVAAQLFSLWLLQGRMDLSRRVNDAVSQALRERAAPVVTGTWWVPQELYAVNRDHPVFLAGSAAAMSSLLDRLCSTGHREVLQVDAARDGGPARRGAAVVTDGRFGYFSVGIERGPACRR